MPIIYQRCKVIPFFLNCQLLGRKNAVFCYFFIYFLGVFNFWSYICNEIQVQVFNVSENLLLFVYQVLFFLLYLMKFHYVEHLEQYAIDVGVPALMKMPIAPM